MSSENRVNNNLRFPTLTVRALELACAFGGVAFSLLAISTRTPEFANNAIFNKVVTPELIGISYAAVATGLMFISIALHSSFGRSGQAQ